MDDFKAGVQRWALAAVAACTAESATFPIDFCKTRLQLQNELVARAAAPRQLGYLQMAAHVARSEGAAALYAGASVAVVRQVFNAGVSIALYPTVRRLALAEGESAADAPLWKRAAAGALTGGLSQALANPADVVKVRVQADGRARLLGRPMQYGGSGLVAVRKIWAAEGVRGFYAALRSSVWRGAVINSAGIASYDATKQLALRAAGGGDAGGWLPQLAGALMTGVVTAVVSAPLDVVKTRMMATPGAYRGPNDCLRQLVATEGLVSLYKGALGGGAGGGRQHVARVCGPRRAPPQLHARSRVRL